MSAKPISVLVLGATGNTGGSIVNGLLKGGGYTVFAGVRPASMEKAPALELKKKGFQLRSFDLDDLTESSLQAAFEGIQIVVSAIYATYLQKQYAMADSAKKAGVERLIPCDFGTAGRRGSMDLLDFKLQIRDYIKEIGVGYTFVDVGWWMQLLFPALNKSQDLYDFPPERSAYFSSTYGDGTVKSAITDKDDIGRYVALILRDPRTLNRYVFCWNEEVTTREYAAVVSAEDLMSKIDKMKAEGDVNYNLLEYMPSMWVLGDNVAAQAIKPEFGSALDTRVLYPDF